MFMRMLPVTVMLWFLTTAASSQPPASPPVPAETAQFDFWVGQWDASWGEGLHGTNHITKRWDRVVVEEFNGKPGEQFEGHSVSVYDPAAKLWKQTWVDSQGGYMDFMGGFADGKMILSRSVAKDGKTVLQRMVWYDITPDAFEWNWERSDDAGKTWQVNWNIHYTRHKKGHAP